MSTDAPRILCPFQIVADTREQVDGDTLGVTGQWTFEGFKARAPHNDKELVVNVVRRNLGFHGGDYTIQGMENLVRVERKAFEDAHGTVLGWGKRRDNFIQELEFLNSIQKSVVIVEGRFDPFVERAPCYGVKSCQENAKALHGSVLSWIIDYPRVQWFFVRNRRLAEVTAFRFLEKFWVKQQEMKKRSVSNAV